jgi:hypothetical protein
MNKTKTVNREKLQARLQEHVDALQTNLESCLTEDVHARYEVEHGLSEASIGAAHPGLIVQLHYKCRDIGYGIEEGTVTGHFTGSRDDYGKCTFKREDGGADLYLFEDEINTVAPVLADDQRECPKSKDRRTVNMTLGATDWELLRDQKAALIWQLEANDHSADPDPLEGLLNWIDAIQDAAAFEGFPVAWLTEETETGVPEVSA